MKRLVDTHKIDVTKDLVNAMHSGR